MAIESIILTSINPFVYLFVYHLSIYLSITELSKDPGIPNLYPFKEQLLQKIENQKAKLEAEQLRQRERRMQEQKKKRQETTSSMHRLASDASSRSKTFEDTAREEEPEDTYQIASIYNVKGMLHPMIP